MVESFRISVPQEQLDELTSRLRNTRWPPGAGGPSEYGISRQYVESLVTYWIDRFDWREVESELNRLPQYRYVSRSGAIHFMHVRPESARHTILITPGWPSTFIEATKLLVRLTAPERVHQHPLNVVVATIPGYGFSEPPTTAGSNAFVVADAWAELMSVLGYENYIVQGGDWGASIATALAVRHPEKVRGLHLNYIPQSYVPHVAPPGTFSEAEQQFLKDRDNWAELHGGYAHVQRREPDTLAFGLNDSPVGLLAWIVDKFRKWADWDGAKQPFSQRDLISIVSIYWFTQSIASSIRLYSEHARAPLRGFDRRSLPMPTAIARFPKEAPFPPREWIERLFNVARWSEFDRGGHFPAWEAPDLLADDIMSFSDQLST